MHGDGFTQQCLQMLDMGPVLHDGVVKRFLATLAFALRRGLVPVAFILVTENPSAIVLTFKHEQALCSNQQHIDFGGAVFALGDVNVEQELSAILFILTQIRNDAGTFICIRIQPAV